MLWCNTNADQICMHVLFVRLRGWGWVRVRAMESSPMPCLLYLYMTWCHHSRKCSVQKCGKGDDINCTQCYNRLKTRMLLSPMFSYNPDILSDLSKYFLLFFYTIYTIFYYYSNWNTTHQKCNLYVTVSILCTNIYFIWRFVFCLEKKRLNLFHQL